MLSFDRLRQTNLIKCVPYEQPDYFAHLINNQPDWFNENRRSHIHQV